MQMVIKLPNVILRYIVQSCTRCHNTAMVVAGSGERVSSRFIISHTCSIGVRGPAEKAHHLPVEEMAVPWG